jgi:exodeoxyribonuclease VIII
MRVVGWGCAPDLSNEDYHASKDYISRSSLMDFDKSPYTYWAKHINPDRPIRESTPQMVLGTAFHTLVLEPDMFDKFYTMELPKVLLKDVGKETYESYKKSLEFIKNCGKTVLSVNDWQNMLYMKEKIKSSKEAMHLISDSRIENSFFWKDEHSGLNLKCRPDILHENMIIDLKTTSNASPRHFQREMVDYGYHIQFAMIRDAVEIIEGRRINNCINIVVETKYPYNMAIYIIDELALEEGYVKYKQLCLDLKNAIAENKFSDYGIQTIGLPRWAL